MAEKKTYGIFSLVFFALSIICFITTGALFAIIQIEAPVAFSNHISELINNAYTGIYSMIKEPDSSTISPAIVDTINDIGGIIGTSKKFEIMFNTAVAFVILGSIFILCAFILCILYAVN